MLTQVERVEFVAAGKVLLPLEPLTALDVRSYIIVVGVHDVVDANGDEEGEGAAVEHLVQQGGDGRHRDR